MVEWRSGALFPARGLEAAGLQEGVPQRAALLSGHPPSDADVVAWLGRQAAVGRYPRWSRIERALPHGRAVLDTDRVIVALLEGAAIPHAPQVYYTRLDCGS